MRADPLDTEFAEDSGSLCAAAFRGYVLHALLFYRQNNLKDFDELVALGGGAAEPARFARGTAAFHVQRGLLAHEPYWGSIRLSDRSLREFERALELEPDCAWAHLLAGMTLEMRRRYTRAIACFDRAHALRPRWSWPLILKGICRWYLADFAGAVADLSAAARLDPKSELPLLFLARAKADLRDASLIKDLDRALALAPRSGFALSWRGRAFFILKKNPEALEDLRRSIALLPDYDRGYSWLGVSYAELGKYSAALPLLEDAARLNPYYPTTLYPLAQCAMKLGRWSLANTTLQAAARIDRHGIWVEHRINMSHPTPACLRSRRELDRFIARRPKSAWAWAWRGQTELLLRNYGRALENLDEAVRLDPKDPWAFVWRGETRRRLGECRAAQADFRRALRLSPELSWARAGLGYCALYAGRWQNALSELDRSLRLQGRCAPALAWRGEANYRLGRFAESIRDWEEAIELHPHEPWIFGWFWRAKARLGDWPGVLSCLKELRRRLGDESDQCWALLGWAYGRLGRERAAAEALGRAVKLNAAQPLALAETACWWRRQGQPKRAAWVWERARRGGAVPRHVGLDDVEALLVPNAPRRRRGSPKWAALRRNPRKTDLQDCLMRSSSALDAGDFLSAIEEASAALDHGLDPTSAAALWLRARAKAAAGRLPEAREDEARLRTLCPGEERDAVAA